MNRDEPIKFAHDIGILSRRAVILLVGLTILLLNLFIIPSSYAQTEVQIGVLAKRGYSATIERWQPLADHLSKKIDGHQFSITPLSFNEVEPAVNEQKVDFILTNSSFYITLERKYGANRIVTLRNRTPDNQGLHNFGGVIFTRSNRIDIQTIEDLKGTRFSAVDERSFGGWQMANLEMKRQGFNPEKELDRIMFTGSHDLVVQAVLTGRADAGTVRTDTLERMQREGLIQINNLKVINPMKHPGFPYLVSTELYPEWPLAKLRHTAHQLSDKVTIALIQLAQNSPVSIKTDTAGWTSAQDYYQVNVALQELGIGYYAKSQTKQVLLTPKEKSWLSQNPKIRVHNETNWPPFNYNQNGKPLGYSVDYMNMVAANLDLQIEYVNGPDWDSFMEMIEDGQLDVMLNIVNTQKRRTSLDFTTPYLEATSGIYTHENMPKMQSLNDLSGLTVAIPKGFFVEELLRQYYPDIKLLPLPDTQACLEAVAFGRANATIGEIGVNNHLLEKLFLSNVKLATQIQDPRFSSIMAIAVNKQQSILRDILQKGMDAISEQQVKELDRKWNLLLSQPTSSFNSLNDNDIKFLTTLKEVRLCVDPNWMPLEGLDKQGHHTGVSAELINIMRTQLPVPIRVIKTTDWSDTLNAVQERRCDLLGMAMNTPKRKQFLNFTQPYLTLPLVIATTKDKKFIDDINLLEGKRVALIENYAITATLMQRYPKIDFVEMKTVKQALEKVASGEVDGFIDAVAPIAYAIEKHGLVNLQISGQLAENWQLSLAVREDLPQLFIIINKLLSQISDETIDNIYRHLIAVKVVEEFNIQPYIKYLVLMVVLLLFLLYRHRQLQLFADTQAQLNLQLSQANKTIIEKEALRSSLLESTAEGIFGIDLQGRATFINPAAAQLLGYEIKELLGEQIHGKIHYAQKDGSPYAEELCPMMQAIIQDGPQRVDDECLWHKDGHSIPVTYSSTPIHKDEQIIGAVIAFTDITELKRIESELEIASVTDQLTGIYNRKYLDEAIGAEIARTKRYDTPFALIMIDIDKFKMVNDLYGHQTGDEVLKQVTAIMQQRIRSSDIIGRWGGEEFMILCPGTALGSASKLAEQLRQAVASEAFETVENCTISLGVAEFHFDDDIDSMVKRVDDALYKAKDAGRNRVEIELSPV